MYGAKRDAVTGGLRNLHNLYFSPNVMSNHTQENHMGRHMPRMGQKKNASRVFMGKAERKDTSGIPTCKWEENIKINLNEM
jgi:hypothetical protein